MCTAVLPLCTPQFDGCAAVHCLVMHRNSKIVVRFAVKMCCIHIIAARLAKIVARVAKSDTITYSQSFHPNAEAYHKSALEA